MLEKNVREFFLVAKMRRRRNTKVKIANVDNPLSALHKTPTGIQKSAQVNFLVSCLGDSINNRTQFVREAESMHLTAKEIQEIWPYFKRALEIRKSKS